ncbi:RTA-like protein [Fusarium oxysporum f. sp. vasinfectum]|uniref:Protein RTM1 n=1 Tax=Fusarium oxysporum f. sp. vasinfectum 25433 TaxID=1089449 RepID=X0KR04_FUSOX|nr:hypothetical protein FOTG_15666 [Fusarium oxysporum f. sp. vasinfectum 25433]KAK2670475.1 RTA-like protein [Fusarium oxysporum f. sp. vasinfectum]KAK2926918.1 RTA-like protein [Fusarium oxysporum f. sp. vasinfectum]
MGLTSLFLIGEIIGYIGRAIGARENPGCWTLGPFVIQSLLILIAPALMAASIYMILGRIILLTGGEKCALIRQRWLTKVFVTGDVVLAVDSVFWCVLRGGLMASENNFEAGEKVIIVGLFVQLVFFGVFMVITAVYHKRLRETPTTRSLDLQVRWQVYLVTLYVAGALIWVRSLFRVVEFIQGNDGPLMRSEAYVFVFDGQLMFIVLAWMNWFHPSEIGLLLRGDQPPSHGLQLLAVPERVGKNVPEGGERLSSSYRIVIGDRGC